MQNSFNDSSRLPLAAVLNTAPYAEAHIKGGRDHPMISGIARFYQTDKGVILYAAVTGLPYKQSPCGSPIFAFHIHEGESCRSGAEGGFPYAKSHYDPVGCSHPYHAGDLPPLFSNHGYALTAFLTDRFTAKEIIGKTMIIHEHPDDFTTQPSGNAGKMIACGEIKKISR